MEPRDKFLKDAEAAGLITSQEEQEERNKNRKARSARSFLTAPLLHAAAAVGLSSHRRKTLKDPPKKRKPCIVCGTMKVHNNAFCSKKCRDDHKART